MSAPESRSPVARQAAADVAQMIRGKRWLQRVTELADAVSVEIVRDRHHGLRERPAT